MKYLIILTLMLIANALPAIELSDNGQGDAIMFPFYTVENEHKSTIKVTNNTVTVKAVKLRFYERFFERDVFSFNVYLAPMDSWEADMVETLSIYRPGEPSVEFLFTDTSCTPFTYSGIQMFPYGIENSPGEYGTDMDRLQTGSIAIIEMGEVIDPEAQHIIFTDGVPNDCQKIQDNWRAPGGIWLQRGGDYSMSTTTGGISAELSVTDTVNHNSFSMTPTVLDNSLLDDIGHTNPGNSWPALISRVETSKLIYNGEIIEYVWDFYTQHLIALLQKTSISAPFDLTQAADTQINWVINLTHKLGATPTSDYLFLRRPYHSILNTEDHGACDQVTVEVRDENGNLLDPFLNQNFRLCETVNVIPIKPFGVVPVSFLDDEYRDFINVGLFEKGTITIKTRPENQMRGENLLDFFDNKIFYGLPITGFQVTRIDDGVNPVVYQHQEFSSTRYIFSHSIFENGFE